jgi:hypothetical protein
MEIEKDLTRLWAEWGKAVRGGGGRRSKRRGHAVEGGDYGADTWAPTHSEGRWSNSFELNSKIQMVYFNSKSFQTLTDSKKNLF